MEYSKLAYYAFLFAMDMKHAKMHAAGIDLERVRMLSDNLEWKAYEDATTFAKLAIMNGEKIDNFSNVRSYVPETEWQSLTGDAIDVNTLAMCISINGQQYLNNIKNIEDKTSEICDMVQFWVEKVVYDNGQRTAVADDDAVATPETPSLSNVVINPPQAAIVAIPSSWRDAGASSALSKSVLGR